MRDGFHPFKARANSNAPAVLRVFRGLAGVWAHQRVTSRTFAERGLISNGSTFRPFEKGALTGLPLVFRLALAERSLELDARYPDYRRRGRYPTIQTNSADARRVAPLNISFP